MPVFKLLCVFALRETFLYTVYHLGEKVGIDGHVFAENSFRCTVLQTFFFLYAHVLGPSSNHTTELILLSFKAHFASDDKAVVIAG